jgi:hypothetical protein
MSNICESCGFVECEGYCTAYNDYIIKQKDAEIDRLKAENWHLKHQLYLLVKDQGD